MKPVAVLPVAGSAPSLDRLGLGVYVGFLAAQVNLVPCAPASISLFIALCDGSLPTIVRVGRP